MNGSEIINILLKELNITAAELAKSIGLSRPQAIYDIQQGKTKNISVRMCDKITSVYKQINSVWLRTGEGNIIKEAITTKTNVFSDSDNEMKLLLNRIEELAIENNKLKEENKLLKKEKKYQQTTGYDIAAEPELKYGKNE